MAYRIPFNSLPLGSRVRLIRCLNDREAPGVLLRNTSCYSRDQRRWLFLLVGGLLLGFAAAFLHFGDPLQAFRQGPGWITAYSLAGGMAAWGLLGMWRRRRLKVDMPWPPGRYVLPFDFVDARRDTLIIAPMAERENLHVEDRYVNGVYTHTMFVFSFAGTRTQSFVVNDRSKAKRVGEQLEKAALLRRRASAEGRAELLSSFDPLHEVRQNGWRLEEPSSDTRSLGPSTIRPLPALLHWAALLALVLGVLGGSAMWLLRNDWSDTIALATIHSPTGTAGRTSDYEAYLAGGGRHVEEVTSRWLPKARIKEARKAGSAAKLRELRALYAGTPHAERAEDALHQLYSEAIETFRHQAAPRADDEQMVPFFVRMMEWLRDHDHPVVTLHFQPPTAHTLATVDELARQFHPQRHVVPVAPHFTDEHNERREQYLYRQLTRSFEEVFANDIFTLEHSGRIPQATEIDWRALESPAIKVRYAVAAAGIDSYYHRETDSHALYVGIEVRFTVTMRLPDTAESYAFDLALAPPERFETHPETRGNRGTPPGGSVYDSMAYHAFDRLRTAMARRFLSGTH